QPSLEGIGELLAVDGVHQRFPEANVANDGWIRSQELWRGEDPALVTNIELALRPLVANLDGLIEQQSPTKREFHFASQDVGHHGARVRDELHDQLVDLRPSENIVVVRGEHYVTSSYPFPQAERTGSHKLLAPVRKVGESGLRLHVSRLQQV